MGPNLEYVPYIPFLINFDKEKFLDEVKTLPTYDYRTWHSCTLYGLSPEKNLSNKNYGLDDTAKKQWFFEDQCPTIINWLKSQKYFIADRVRVWKVHPGEIGAPHIDASSPHINNLIIPINNPTGFKSIVNNCHVPMDHPVIYNNFLEHSFTNNSLNDRWSLIIRVKEWINNKTLIKERAIKTIEKNIGDVDENSIREIQWETFVKFLFSRSHITLDHVQRMSEYCGNLGALKSKNKSPKYNHYGLFDNTELIGVTSIQEFSDFIHLPDDAVRYRYLYVDEEYRGNDLAYKMLNYLVPTKPLFGYAKNTHIPWCLKHGFKPIFEVDETGHQFMLRNEC